MTASFTHSGGMQAPIRIPAIGLDLFVRLPPAASEGEFCFINQMGRRVPGTAAGPHAAPAG